MKKLLLLILLIGVAATVFLYDYAINQPLKISEDTLFLVNKGDSLKKIAQSLQDTGLAKDKHIFILFSKITTIYPQINAGA